jgi:hypothetical protein
MRRFILLGCAAVAAVGVLAGTASATPPTHFTQAFAGSDSEPGGTLCDFNISESFTGTSDVTTFSDGTVNVHQTIHVIHVNEDTGYTLTENDVVNLTFYNDGTSKQVGIGWHLRDANGKIVLVHAGLITFDADGNVVRFTPNSGPGFAEVVCPALGGNPV